MVNRLKLERTERLYFSELHGLAVDSRGNEVLCGLSRAESEEFLSLSHDRIGRCPDYRDRYNALERKYRWATIALSDAALQALRTGRAN
jgi:hypothetical protein